MPLTPEQKQKVSAWLTSKKVNPVCPSCGNTEWGSGEIISGMPYRKDGAMIVGERGVPMIQLGCLNCGYVKLYLVHESMKLF